MVAHRRLLLGFLFFTLTVIAATPSFAAPTRRGFQIPPSTITASVLDELVSTWKVNVLRVQIGDNANMDGLTGAAYDAMMEAQFDLLDEKLPLIAARGLKVIFVMYSPPGGFETREAPSHYKMFSDVVLQDAFIAKWREIMARYGSNSTIVGFDLVNEPAQRKGVLGIGARNWNDLVLATITAIRETHPQVTLLVKPLYGDPSKLTALPAISDVNVVYSYNAYFFNNYQHSGVYNAPYSSNPPSQAEIDSKARGILSRFYSKVYNRVQTKNLPATAFPPRLSVGEVTVSACATGGATFMSGLLASLETDESADGVKRRARVLRGWRRARKLNKGLKKPVFDYRWFKKDVEHDDYVIHAFNDATVWDPRYVCDASGNLSFSGANTDTANVLKSFFALNR